MLLASWWPSLTLLSTVSPHSQPVRGDGGGEAVLSLERADPRSVSDPVDPVLTGPDTDLTRDCEISLTSMETFCPEEGGEDSKPVVTG